MSARVLQVPKALHAELIGQGGSTVKNIQQQHGVRVLIPGRDDPSSAITVSGPSAAAIEAAERAMAAIVGFALSSDPLTTVNLQIAGHECGRLIGPGGATLKGLQKAHAVGIETPRKGSEGSAVVVQGKGADVAAAVKAIEALLGHTVGQDAAPVIADVPHVAFGPDTAEALFFSDDAEVSARSFARFLAYISSATKTLDVCVFNITDDRISGALISLFARGVKVRVITDNDQSVSVGSDIAGMRSAGIPVKQDSSPAHMHHKFAVIDNACLINGSFNWTRGASTANNENVMVLGHPALIHAYAAEFERLWKRF